MRRDVAGDDRSAVRGRFEQRDRQTLEVRRLHERSGVGVQLGERVTEDVARQQHAWVLGRRIGERTGVAVGVARSSGEDEAEIAGERREGAYEPIRCLLGHEATDEQQVLAGA